MLNILPIKPFKYHQLVDKDNNLYIVSNDNVKYGISGSSYYIDSDGYQIDNDLRVPLKYEIIKYYRIDRILAKYNGKYGFVSADLIPYIYDGSREDPLFYQDYEIVIPFLFDKIEDKGDGLFEVNIDGHTFPMDIEAIIEVKDIEKIKHVLAFHYRKCENDPNTNIYIPECMFYSLMDDHRLCLQTSEADSVPYHIVGRGWLHTSNDYGVDYEEYTIHGVIDNNGKCIIPTIFEQIEILDGLLEGYILAKYRYYLSDGKTEVNVCADEKYGDLFLFTVEGECVLGGFSNIVMVDNDTFHIYLNDYIYDTDGSLNVYNGSSFIILNKEFALKEINNPEATYRNTYLDEFVAEKNPFHKDLLKRLELQVTPVPQTITHHNKDREEIDCFYDDEN